MDSLVQQVQAVLSMTAPRWQQLTASLPADLLTRAPQTGEWSAADCLQHLLDAERWVFPVRVKAILTGENFPAYDPDAEGTVSREQSPAQLAAEFAELRAQSLKVLATVTEQDLSRLGNHPELGQVTMAQLLNEWAAHDLMHTVQAERSLMQPFIADCGPWRYYFKDHDAHVPS